MYPDIAARLGGRVLLRELNSDAETSELMRLTDSTTEKNATLDPNRTERADGND